MATIKITDLKLRTIIGTMEWERENKQDILINITFDYDASKASQSDNIDDAVDYKKITKKIIKEVEASKFFLIEKLSQMILDIVLASPLIEKAAVRIDKPYALRFADSVSIEQTQLKRQANRVVVGLGSNIEPEKNIASAREALSESFKVLSESNFTQTQPVGPEGQTPFLNGSILIETEQPLKKLNQSLKQIEENLGRFRTANKFDPRTIDLDIVVYNGKIIDSDFYQRNFLKESVLEVCPDLKY